MICSTTQLAKFYKVTNSIKIGLGQTIFQGFYVCLSPIGDL